MNPDLEATHRSGSRSASLLTVGLVLATWIATPGRAQAPPPTSPGLPPAAAPLSGNWRPADLCSRAMPSGASVHTGAPVPSAADLERQRSVSGRAGGPVSTTAVAIAPSPWDPCSPSELAKLSSQALVQAIATGAPCLDPLWSFDAVVATVVRPENVEAIGNAMVTESQSLSANADRLTNLAYFYQIAFYHEWYQSTVSYSGAVVDAAQQGMAAMAANPDFLLETPPVKELRYQWITSIDSVNGTHLVLGAVEALLDRYVSDPGLKLQYQERLLAFRVFSTIARQIWNNNIDHGTNSPWWNLVPPSLMASIEPIALDLGYNDDTEYVTLNAIYALANMSVLDAPTASEAHRQVSEAYWIFPLYSAPWLRAVMDLDYFYNATLFGGEVLDMEQIRSDVKAIALPEVHTFDQGRLVFETALSLADTEALYDAIQEVDSHFFRKTTVLDPVAGDQNDELTLVIYGSPADYDLYQPFLYGLSTNNGGIYIEGWSTLFTYDRESWESIFTLEELLRHEYTHYLDGRFMVEGGWYGSGTLYEGGRLDTYGEGLAEYMVGARRTDGILPRGILLYQIDGDPDPMTVAEILYSTYNTGGFKFYPYAGLLMNFLETERADLQVALFDAIRADDAAAVDALYAQMAGDPILEADYAAFLTTSLASWKNGTDVFAEDVPTDRTPPGLPTDNAEAVRQTLQAQAPTATGAFQVWKERYQYVDQLDLTISAGSTPGEVREEFDAAMDEALTTLAPFGRNFQTPVSWAGELSWNGTLATGAYVIEGPYLATSGDTVAPAAPTSLVATGGFGSIALTWNANTEADLAGYRVYRSDQTGGPYSRLNTTTVTEPSYNDTTAPMGELFYVVTAVDAIENESPYSNEAVGGAPIRILVVNGYFESGNLGYVDHYTDSLLALGMGYDIWDPFVDGEVTSAVLAPYVDGMVIWAVGYYHPSYPGQFNQTRREAIKDYLDQGGSFVFSGAYKAGNIQGTELFQDYFHAQYVQHSVHLEELDGVAQNPIGNGLDLSLSYGGYASEVDVTAPAASAFLYVPGSGSGQVQSSGTAVFTVDGTYKVVYLAFPFSYLVASDRNALTQRMTDWILP